MSDTNGSIFAFHPFRLDPSIRQLSRDGQAIALTPKEFDTLLVLVEAGGSLVDKEDLVSRVWPDSYVGDGSLARNISVLRKALGDDVIETHRGRGYRITLPVTLTERVPAGTLPQTERQTDVPLSAAEPTPQVNWWKGWGGYALAATVLLFIGLVLFRFSAVKNASARASVTVAPIHSILIQKEGAIDPLDEGFKLFRAETIQYPRVLYNRETNGWDRWRLATDDQNYYYRPLSVAEKDFALQHDWKLTCVCALESGGGFADIDFAGKGPRFDIELVQEGSRYFVALTNQISPVIELHEKIEFPGVSDVAHPHTYELRYDHVSKTASLWIDGKQMAAGYRGHHQFQEDKGLLFGVAIYGGVAKSSVVFREVRFESK